MIGLVVVSWTWDFAGVLPSSSLVDMGQFRPCFSKFLEQILSLSEPHPPCLHVISDMPCSHESELFS